MSEAKKYNVVFLLDQNPPQRVAMLQRATNKDLAPGFFTGIGGKIEEYDETILKSAYRELEEETGITNSDVELTEFSRCRVGDRLLLYFFSGVYPRAQLPKTEDGDFTWVNIESILEKDIIPDTKLVMAEWKKRKFDSNYPFSIEVIPGEFSRGVTTVKSFSTSEGLLEL